MQNQIPKNLPRRSRKAKEGWQKVKLGDLTQLEYGRGLTESKRLNGTIPVYGSNGIVGYHNERLVNGKGIVVGRKGTIGHIEWADNDFWPIDTTYFIQENNKYNLRWLYYLLSSLNLKNLNRATGVPGLNREDVYKISTFLPKIKTQKKIADILSSIDEAIQKTDQLIQKTEVLKQGLVRELLTKGIGHKKFQKTKIGEIPEEWEVTSVGKICGCIVPGRNKPKMFNGNIPWITTPNIKDSKIDYKSNINFVSKEELLKCGNKIIPTNSVIMTCVGEFGIITVVDQEISINQQLHAFLPSKHVIPTFLRLSLENQREQMYNLATKTSVPYLNKTNCNSILIAKPPIVEQQIITKIIVSIEDQVSANKKLLNQLISLKNGLMHDIFSQKIHIN